MYREMSEQHGCLIGWHTEQLKVQFLAPGGASAVPRRWAPLQLPVHPPFLGQGNLVWEPKGSSPATAGPRIKGANAWFTVCFGEERTGERIDEIIPAAKKIELAETLHLFVMCYPSLSAPKDKSLTSIYTFYINNRRILLLLYSLWSEPYLCFKITCQAF